MGIRSISVYCSYDIHVHVSIVNFLYICTLNEGADLEGVTGFTGADLEGVTGIASSLGLNVLR